VNPLKEQPRRETLDAFSNLFSDFRKVNWQPKEELPIEVIRWMSVGHILLDCYRSAIEELEQIGANSLLG